MPAPKLKTSALASLYGTPAPDKQLRDKQEVEALRERLARLLERPGMDRKAALILEHWLHQPTKK
jgi:hypothetical protein